MRPVLAAVGLMCALVVPAVAQNPPDTTRSAQDSTLRVFFDCSSFLSGCDLDYFRTEITFVNHVRAPEDADVHVLITSQTTGGGGTEYTIALIGRRRHAGQADTLRYVAGKTDTNQERRRGLTHTIRLGLVRYAATTPLAPQLDVSYTAPLTAGAHLTVHDPWNYWVFSLSGNGFFNGQKSFNSQSMYGSASANRVTADLKVLLSAYESYNRNAFDVPIYDSTGALIGTQTIVSISRSYGGDALIVRSLGGHWSAGIEISADRSTYRNEDLALKGGPAIEFDVFPYDQSTRKLLRFLYRVTANHFRYSDTTIFERVTETRAQQALVVGLSATQPWGTAFGTLTGSTYLYDFHKNNLELFGGVSVRVVRGLSFSVSGDVSLVHDQLFLPKRGASEAEVLLQRRALATSYQYFASAGLSFSFGSKINNVVNPRFGRSGGGSSTICFSN